MNITQNLMKPEQYENTKTKKTQIILHHTAGSHRPDYTIDGWEANTEKIGTHFCIGGKSTSNGDISFDGKIYQAIPEENWIWHLGAKGTNGKFDKCSIGIEICNYGALTLKNGVYLNYVNKSVPASDVVDLGYIWRGSRYYHKYTDGQIAALKELLLYLGKKYNINLKKVWSIASFETDIPKFSKDGIATHVNYRTDKNDIVPQINMVTMLNSL